jgi:hypothetical protein
MPAGRAERKETRPYRTQRENQTRRAEGQRDPNVRAPRQDLKTVSSQREVRKRETRFDRKFLQRDGELHSLLGTAQGNTEYGYRAQAFYEENIVSEEEDEQGDRGGGTNRESKRSSRPEEIEREAEVKEDERDRATKVAQLRNLARIKRANEKDEEILGKYLPNSIDAFFPVRMIGPDDHFLAPDSWVTKITQVAQTPCPTPEKSVIRFDLSADSLEANGSLLIEHEFDFADLLESQKGSTVWHGSEFRSKDHISTVLGAHPILDYLEDTFSEGMSYHFNSEISEESRRNEVKTLLARGNHKSAEEKIEVVERLLAREVKHGFCMPFAAKLVPKVKGALVQPCGLATQFSLQADGSRKEKERLTHDLSFSTNEERNSVNDRIDMSRYPEMFYGWCLLRTIHFIVCLRCDNPGRKIFISKYDYSDAYRRISHSAQAAVQTIIVLAGIAYLSLRLAFGGSPNPACFCAFSEALTDLSNELSCSNFDPDEVRSPVVEPSTLRETDYPTEFTPIAEGIPPAVEVPTTLDSRKDCFIDDIVVVFLATTKNLKREVHSVPLAAHLLSRPHAGEEKEPVPRKPLFAPDKLIAEGTPAEIMMVLGWLLNTRLLLVRLPPDKFVAWSADLIKIIAAGSVTFGELESTVGRLNHASFLIPLSRHFLNGLRDRLTSLLKHKRSNRTARQVIRLTADEIADLQLWSLFLEKAEAGISMNLLTIRVPTGLAWSDSCPFGVGGYTQKGFAWRIRIPASSPFFGDDTVNNVLEFLGQAISVKLLLLEAKDEKYPCLLPLGDNTSGIGWMFKSGKLKKGSRYYEPVKMISREVATSVLERDAQLTAQHLRGDYNDVSDTLSYAGRVRGKTSPLTEDDPPDDVLTQRFHKYSPQLIPSSFVISPLPEEIMSFVLRVMRTLEASWTPNKTKPTLIKRGLGPDGKVLCGPSVSWTRSDLEYPTTNSEFSPSVSLSSLESLSSTDRVTLLRDVRDQWWYRLSETPSAIWVRRFGQINGTAPSTSKAGPKVAKATRPS